MLGTGFAKVFSSAPGAGPRARAGAGLRRRRVLLCSRVPAAPPCWGWILRAVCDLTACSGPRRHRERSSLGPAAVPAAPASTGAWGGGLGSCSEQFFLSLLSNDLPFFPCLLCKKHQCWLTWQDMWIGELSAARGCGCSRSPPADTLSGERPRDSERQGPGGLCGSG